MFKKTKIAAVSAAVLGLSSMTAQAVSLNEAGSEGQVLIFPYYNVNNGFITAYNITNTTNAFKAVKVRFRESENSNDVLDFNVYMSPYDVFTINLSAGSDEGVKLTTTDKTCTHPAIPEGGVLFRHGAYTSTSVADVREGYLEVIEMGELVETAVTTINGNSKNISNGVLHSNGVPNNCDVINAAWDNGDFTQGGAAANTGAIDRVNPKSPGHPAQNFTSHTGYYGKSIPANLTKPMGGLVGTSILIDTINIAGFVAEPVSVVNYSTQAQHYLSSDEHFYLLPSLASGSVSTSEDASGTATYSTVVRDFGMDDRDVLPRTSVPSGINPMPMADALLAVELGNQYFLGEGTLTDWVVSLPMRKHGIYNDYRYVAPGAGLTDLPAGAIPVAGSNVASANANGYWAFEDANDVNASFVYYDREEGVVVPKGDDFSPPITTQTVRTVFDREVNIFPLRSAGASNESVLGSDNAEEALNVETAFVDGWGNFSFDNNVVYDLAGTRYAAWVVTTPASALGVPVTGFMAAKSDIGSESVGETFPHWYTK